MKKSLCIALVLVLTACCFPVHAETAKIGTAGPVVITPDDAADFSAITKELGSAEPVVPERPSGTELYTKEIGESENEITRAVTNDSVFISGNTCTVMVPGAMTFYYTAPSNVLVLTQDIIQQSGLYSSVYSNPKEICDSFISNGMHLNLYDRRTQTDLYLYVYRTSLADVYANANNLTEDEAIYIIKYLFSLEDYFMPCDEATYGYAGGNVWLIGDARAAIGKIFLCSFVNGLEVWGVASAKTDEQYNAVIDMLDTLIIN